MTWTVVFVGPPGCGKGTQASWLAEERGAIHFDMGSVLRTEIEGGGELADEIASYSEHGRLVPLPTIRKLVEKFFREHTGEDVLLDGFPRSLDQVELLKATLPAMGRKIDAVVLFELDERKAISRIVDRRQCPDCGAVYNLKTKPPVNDERCDDCGIELVRRRDDSEDVMRERMRVYREETIPVIEHFRGLGLLEVVDASGDSETVAERIRGRLNLHG